MTTLLIRLWRHIGEKRRWQVGGIFLLTILASFFEVFSIGAIIPFLGAMLQPEKIATNAYFKHVLDHFNIEGQGEIILALTVLFCLAAALSGAMRLTLMWAQTRLSYSIGSDFALGIYRRMLYREYAHHLASNSSETISAVSVKADIVVREVLFPLMTIAGSFVMLVAILGLLFVADPFISLLSILGFGCIYLVVFAATRSKLHASSKVANEQSGLVVKTLQEGLGGIRDIIVDGSQEAYAKIYLEADNPLRRARANIHIISNSPRYVMEASGLIFISILAFMLSRNGALVSAIPVLGLLALGIQRLLPVLQHAYSGWACIRGAQHILISTLALLDQPLPSRPKQVRPLHFTESIRFRRVAFRYGQAGDWVLKDIDLEIRRGQRLGIIGQTGGGKSTLLDVLMGLLQPTEGEVLVDHQALDYTDMRAWHSLVSHVPQNIYIADTSIAENIAFGVPVAQIDMSRVHDAATQAQLADFIQTMPNAYQTVVGERGARLSGGQRQRIGIARALYKASRIIILDEATSALDGTTETSVISSIESLDRDITIIMVAHRLSTLRSCTKVIELKDGSIHRCGTYDDFVQV